MVSRVVQDLFRIASPDVLAKDLPEVMQVLTKVGDESMLRVDLLEQIPHIAAQAVECSVRVSALKNVVSEYLIPLVVRNLGSSETGVDKAAHATLIHLIEHGYITKPQAEIQVCPSILALSKVENHLDVNTGAVTLMSKLAPLLGRDVTERVFLNRFSELCASHMFYVRKVSASHFGDFCAVVGKDAFETILLPCYMALCNDEIWGVRKACAEVIMFVSCACPAYTRRTVLAPVFAKLLQDECRWVRMSAFQTLGPFISTFADPVVTSIGYNNIGNLVLMNGDGSEFLMSSPSVPDNRPSPLQNFFHERDSRFDNLDNIDVNNCEWIWGDKGGGDQTPLEGASVKNESPPSCESQSENSNVEGEVSKVEVENTNFQGDSNKFEVRNSSFDIESSKEETNSVNSTSIEGGMEPKSEVKDEFIKEIVETVKNAVLSYRKEEMIEQGFIGDNSKKSRKLETIPLSSKPIHEHQSLVASSNSSTSINVSNCTENDNTATETNNTCKKVQPSKNNTTWKFGKSNEDMVKPSNNIDNQTKSPTKDNKTINNSKSVNENLPNFRNVIQEAKNLLKAPPKAEKPIECRTISSKIVNENSRNNKNVTQKITDGASSNKNAIQENIYGAVGEKVNTTVACTNDESARISTTEDDLFFYNSYRYWYISPGAIDVSLPLLVDSVDDGKEGTDIEERAEQSERGTAGVTSKLEELYSMISLSDIVDETAESSTIGDTLNSSEDLIIDSTLQDDKNQSDSTLPPQEPEAPPQDIVPQQLIDHFVSMTNPNLALNIDNEMTYHCAYSLPAVALTLGRDNWVLLKDTVDCLAGDMQYKVRRTVASGLHELASILGPEIATDNLAPLFDGFLKDLDEVRIGVLKHLAHFLRLISPTKRIQYLPRLQEFLQTDNEWNWRFRQELAKQLLLAVTLFKPADVAKHIGAIAQDLMCDKVAAIRQVALQLVTEILRYISSEPGLTPSLLVKLAEKFAHSKRWKRRQTFALLCSELLLSEALPVEQFSSEVLPHLLDLSWDQVANVRLVVARCLSQHIMTNEYFSDPSNEDFHSLETVLRRLQADKDRDVRQNAELCE